MTRRICVLACLSILPLGAVALPAVAQGTNDGPAPMIGRRQLAKPGFYHHRPSIDIVDESPIVHFPPPDEVSPPVSLIDGQTILVPKAPPVGSAAPIAYQTKNPMVHGTEWLAPPGFQSNIHHRKVVQGPLPPGQFTPVLSAQAALNGRLHPPANGISVSPQGGSRVPKPAAPVEEAIFVYSGPSRARSARASSANTQVTGRLVPGSLGEQLLKKQH